jgi:hypothetical protein
MVKTINASLERECNDVTHTYHLARSTLEWTSDDERLLARTCEPQLASLSNRVGRSRPTHNIRIHLSLQGRIESSHCGFKFLDGQGEC